MPGDITSQPLARAVLRHLADNRSGDDALGSLARSVLSGETALQTAAANPWHGRGLTTAFAGAQDERNRMGPDQAASYERQAERLRDDAAGAGCAEDDR